MRVTSEMMVSSTLRRLDTRLERYERAQSRLATGRAFLQPSDDPGAARQAMALRAEVQSHGQELRNIGDATSWLDHTDSVLQSALTRLHRARDLGVRGASTQGQPALDAIATEMSQIRDELAGIANTTHEGRSLFAGTNAAPVVAADGTWSGNVGGVVRRRISDTESVQVNVTGDQVFGPTGELFRTLDEVIAALRSGDTAAVGAGLSSIDDAEKRLGAALASIGATSNRVEAARSRVDDRQLILRGQLAQVEDVDIADAIMDLQVEEVAYQATLGALARALPPSLVSFLA